MALPQFVYESHAHKLTLTHVKSNQYESLESYLHHLLRYANNASNYLKRLYWSDPSPKYSNLGQYRPVILRLPLRRFPTNPYQNHDSHRLHAFQHEQNGFFVKSAQGQQQPIAYWLQQVLPPHQTARNLAERKQKDHLRLSEHRPTK